LPIGKVLAMAAQLEVWRPDGRDVVVLEGERVTIGRAESNDVSIGGDPELSRLHAVLEPVGDGWCVRDLASSNGTFVNGERVWADRPLRQGDEIRIGRTRIVFRGNDPVPDMTRTRTAEPPPDLTRRERDVLVALCQPVLSADLFTEPASIRTIAERLVVTEAAVKQHLIRLYDKFGVYESGERRRVRLANEAIRRGAVTLADLREDDRTT
jgi:predicted component of type VI protein secretion system